MKKYLFGLTALISIAVFSAFTSVQSSTKSEPEFFFKYSGPANPTSLDIQDINNYERSELTCEGGEHVCGVFLETDGTTPDVDEFDAVKAELWNSENSGFSTEENLIIMKD